MRNYEIPRLYLRALELSSLGGAQEDEVALIDPPVVGDVGDSKQRDTGRDVVLELNRRAEGTTHYISIFLKRLDAWVGLSQALDCPTELRQMVGNIES